MPDERHVFFSLNTFCVVQLFTKPGLERAWFLYPIQSQTYISESEREKERNRERKEKEEKKSCSDTMEQKCGGSPPGKGSVTFTCTDATCFFSGKSGAAASSLSPLFFCQRHPTSILGASYYPFTWIKNCPLLPSRSLRQT